MITTYHIQTFGCMMNEYDSERIAAILEQSGYLPATDPNKADIVILNTCSVRERPQHKVSSYIGALDRSRTRTGYPKKIGLMGCVAQQVGESYLKHNQALSFIVGTDGLPALADIIEQVMNNNERIAYTAWEESSFKIDEFERKEATNGLVTIMKGCNNYCSYCIVPYVRGIEKSRKTEEIITEVEALVHKGIKEITLLGQNVNSYGHGKGDSDLEFNTDFPQLLAQVANIKGISRLRFMTSHPKDFNKEMVHVIRDNENICPYIHLPIQSGSNRILKLMNRGYTLEQYYEMVEYAKHKIPHVQFSSDFIVGFPTETDDDFQLTKDILAKMQYEQAFIFNYSEREGTTASKTMPDEVPYSVKVARLSELNVIQKAIIATKSEALVNSKIKILVEGVSKTDSAVFSGRTVHSKIVNFKTDSDVKPGDEIEVLITEAKRHSVFGIY